MNRGILVLCLLPALTLAIGCGKGKPERKYYTLKGTAERIDADTGEVSMRAYIEKQQQWRVYTGQATDQTEVMINGRQAKLGDINPGDEGEVTGYIEGEGFNKRLVATKISITREEAFSTSGPADEPNTTP